MLLNLLKAKLYALVFPLHAFLRSWSRDSLMICFRHPDRHRVRTSYFLITRSPAPFLFYRLRRASTLAIKSSLSCAAARSICVTSAVMRTNLFQFIILLLPYVLQTPWRWLKQNKNKIKQEKNSRTLQNGFSNRFRWYWVCMKFVVEMYGEEEMDRWRTALA